MHSICFDWKLFVSLCVCEEEKDRERKRAHTVYACTHAFLHMGMTKQNESVLVCVQACRCVSQCMHMHTLPHGVYWGFPSLGDQLIKICMLGWFMAQAHSPLPPPCLSSAMWDSQCANLQIKRILTSHDFQWPSSLSHKDNTTAIHQQHVHQMSCVCSQSTTKLLDTRAQRSKAERSNKWMWLHVQLLLQTEYSSWSKGIRLVTESKLYLM